MMAIEFFLIFGKGRWDMGLKDKLKQYNEQHKEHEFHPLDLNEDNVQVIFDRCLTKKDSKNRSTARLFLNILGYEKDDKTPITFDRDILVQNKKNIRYLYGQLDCVHTGKYLSEWLPVTDFAKTYTGEKWTQKAGILLELLYLASNGDIAIIVPFEKMKNDSTLIHPSIKPTLSPKDPEFPEWWEQHKAEWED